jgi:putative transposase
MPRKTRQFMPGVPCHVIQRGNNRQSCFMERSDYRDYLRWLGVFAGRHGVAIHAYVLMTNHVHLLLSPSTEGDPKDDAIARSLLRAPLQ